MSNEKRDVTFETWLKESQIDKITPRNGHARRAFDAGYDAAQANIAACLERAEADVTDAYYQSNPSSGPSFASGYTTALARVRAELLEGKE